VAAGDATDGEAANDAAADDGAAPGDAALGEAILAQPLGVPIAQLHGLYILAQNREGLILVDTHAAHERVLYEQLKAQYDAAAPAAQLLLEPLPVRAAEHELDALWLERAELERLGFELQREGVERLCVRRVPVLLARVDVVDLLAQLARELRTRRRIASWAALPAALRFVASVR
jgi:DNA mismatch repair protein MutL